MTPSRCSRRPCCSRRSAEAPRQPASPRRCSRAARAPCSPRPPGAPACTCRSSPPTTKRRLAKVLPHFASQNNPLDVTGQAAVETEMYEGALDALANDPAVGADRLRRVPAAPRGRDAVGRPGADARSKELRRETGVVFASVAMSPLAYARGGEGLHERRTPCRSCRAITPPRARSGRSSSSRASKASGDRRRRCAPHPEPRDGALRVLRGRAGPIDEAGGRQDPAALRGAAAAGADASRRPSSGGGVRPRRSGSRSSVKALAPEIPHKAKLGGVRLGLRERRPTSRWPPPRCSRPRSEPAPARREVLVQQMAAGAEVLVGAVVDERFGADDHDATRRRARRAGRGGLRAVPAHAGAGSRLRGRPGGALRARPARPRSAARRRGRSRRSRASRTTSAAGSPRSRRTRCSWASAAPWPSMPSRKSARRDLRPGGRPRLGSRRLHRRGRWAGGSAASRPCWSRRR